MNKEELVIFYNEIERKRKEMHIMEKQVQQIDNEIQLEIEQYRKKSVKRVLEYINDKCWGKENIDNLHTLIVHCLNKLNGNLDGVEISLKEE